MIISIISLSFISFFLHMYGSGLSIMFAASIWGIDGFVRQNVSLPGTLLVAIEMSLAGLIILLWTFFMRRHEIKKIRKMGSFLTTVLLGGVAGMWFFVNALKATDSLGFVFVLIGLQPVFTIVSSAIFLGEHPRGSFYAYAATTITASILLTIGDTGWNLSDASLIAYAYALGTAICWGISTTFYKIVAENNAVAYSMGLRFFLMGIIAWGIVIITHEYGVLSPTYITQWPFLLSLTFLVFVSDILAGYVYLAGLRSIPATLSTIFELTFPLTGFVLDFMVHDIVPSPLKIVAAITVLMSIVILPYCHFIEERRMNGDFLSQLT